MEERIYRCCGGAYRPEGVQAECEACGRIGYLAEPGLSPRERYVARRRLDEMQTRASGVTHAAPPLSAGGA